MAPAMTSVQRTSHPVSTLGTPPPQTSQKQRRSCDFKASQKQQSKTSSLGTYATGQRFEMACRKQGQWIWSVISILLIEHFAIRNTGEQGDSTAGRSTSTTELSGPVELNDNEVRSSTTHEDTADTRIPSSSVSLPSGSNSTNPYGVLPQPTKTTRKTFNLLYVPDPSRRHTSYSAVTGDLGWVRRVVSEEQYREVKHLKGCIFEVKKPTIVERSHSGRPVYLTEWVSVFRL